VRLLLGAAWSDGWAWRRGDLGKLTKLGAKPPRQRGRQAARLAGQPARALRPDGGAASPRHSTVTSNKGPQMRPSHGRSRPQNCLDAKNPAAVADGIAELGASPEGLPGAGRCASAGDALLPQGRADLRHVPRTRLRAGRAAGSHCREGEITS